MLVDGQARAANGLVLVRLPPVPTLSYGEPVRVQGMLELPRSDDDFDYRAYLARRNIFVLMSEPDLTTLPGNNGAWWQRTALQLNDYARTTSLHLIGEPHASLLVGILLGVQSTIPEDLLDAFSATGTSHILVISGWNITIIIIGITTLLGQLGIGRRRAAALSLPLLALYVLFVGASPAVLRAALMGSLVVFATLVERDGEAWTSFFVACSLMALLDPNVLWNIGFQLSALATAGLFAWARPIEGWLVGRPPFCWRVLHWAAEPLTATLAASSLSLPIILYHFGNLSLIAPLANVLILPAVPYAMLWGSLATVCGMVWLPLGQCVALLAWPFLQWLVFAAQWLARVPGASTNVGSFHIGWLWGYYALIVALKITTEARKHGEKGILAQEHEQSNSA
jgi:competence protein ComEC